ncbi:hypothetical protein C8046_17915 [Serinibacter arcticus]|uniref:Alpha-glucosidase n=1 Tax=Serinibacter arcticus TaxID=1655435 RepID=A0A2U1ZZ17_9MICO|nr:glycoside hydrolase family 97 catalytic domain-containing protein [Serinibacter arcticus]PWD52235.1 hypothetical protein C8046_17915 [Serinibacter arcticus]
MTTQSPLPAPTTTSSPPRRGRRAVALATVGALLGSGLTALLAVAPAAAAPTNLTHSVSSPDGSLEVGVGLVDGRLTYDVTRDGSLPVVADSGLGLRLGSPSVDLTSGLTITDTARAEIDETWTPAWGTVSSIENRANELVVSTVHPASGVELDVTFRVFDDGVGFRYTFPEQDALPGPFDVLAEDTRFALPNDLTAYFVRAGRDWNADEKHYQTRPVGEVPDAQTPITFSRPDGLFLALHEADLTDFSAMTVVQDASAPRGTFRSELIALPGGVKSIVDASDGGFDTPWRTLTVGRTAGDLAESHLIANLNDPCAICDVDSDGDGVDDTTDWITPATYTGVWWELQRRFTTWTAGPNQGATTANTKRYIDLAVDMGAKFVLVEGWNVNAGGNWLNQDFVTPNEGYDIEEVLAYAADRGIGIVGHNETRGRVDYYDAHMEEIFAQYAEWGISSIKTGYATAFLLGGVNRSHYDQEAVRHYQRVTETAARYGITVNAHESIKPTGLNRTYPNMMTSEGVAGMEQQGHMGVNGNPPEQATILPFTRWIGGPADYTPGVLNVTWDPAPRNSRVQSTTANQLALYTTFYSPLQMFADTPDNYAMFPEEVEYLRGMPATWDDSRVDAEIGDWIVTSRRSGETWYTGVVTDENDRAVPVPLDFLDEDTTYLADIYTDGADASWKGNPLSVQRVKVLVDSTDTVIADIVGAGGAAFKLTPATAEELASVPPLVAASLSLVGEPEIAYEPGTGVARVTATAHGEGSLVSSAPVVLYVDGTAVGERTVRLAPGGEATFTYEFPWTATADGHSRIALGDADGPYDEGDRFLVAPVLDSTFRTAVVEAAAAGTVPADALAELTQRARALEALAELGETDAWREGAQDLRAELLLRDGLDAGVIAELDDLLDVYLGAPAGIMGVLARVPALTGELDDGGAAAARTAASALYEAAAAGYDHLVPGLRTQLGSAVGTGPTGTAIAADLTAMADGFVLEVEDGVFYGGARTSAEHPGYTGTGFGRSFDRVGAGVDLPFQAAAATTYTVSLRYANGMVVEPFDRTISMWLNDSAPQRVDLPRRSTAADRWRNYGYTPSSYELNGVGGTNALTLEYLTGDTGNANIDHARVVPGDGVRERTRDEAEDARLTGGARVASAVGDFTGTGYVEGLATAGAASAVDLDVPVTGRYVLQVQGSGGDGPATVALAVGGAVHEVTLGAGGWSWGSVAVDLTAGPTTVTATATVGDPRLDALAVRLVALPAGAADAPTGATAVLEPGNTVSLTWTPPVDTAGSPLAGYRVWVSVDGVEQAPVDVAADATTLALTSIVEGATYSFQVAAVTGAGEGLRSTPSNEVTTVERPFVDVPVGSQFFAEISWLLDRGISTGWSTPAGQEFRPVTPIARDAMAAFLYRLAGSPDVELPAVSPFVDVAPTNQFYVEIAWLAQEGISTGWSTPAGAQFRPLEPIARDAMAAFLYRYADSPAFEAPATSPFADVPVGSQFHDEIAWMADEGIATGWQGGNDGTDVYRPLAPVNRDAMAAFLYRYEHRTQG